MILLRLKPAQSDLSFRVLVLYSIGQEMHLPVNETQIGLSKVSFEVQITKEVDCSCQSHYFRLIKGCFLGYLQSGFSNPWFTSLQSLRVLSLVAGSYHRRTQLSLVQEWRKATSKFLQALGIYRSEVYSSGSTCLPCPLIWSRILNLF